jgi:uncharacterized protein (UPF0333 family)
MTQSPARLYALVVGAVLLAAGIVGFFYSSSFGSPGEVDTVFGILDVNGWHNVVHIVTGALGLLAWRYAAREYALGLGLVYVVVAIWGFVIGDGESILGFIPINTEDNVLHLAIGLAGLAAGWATEAAPTRATPGGAAPAH